MKHVRLNHRVTASSSRCNSEDGKQRSSLQGLGHSILQHELRPNSRYFGEKAAVIVCYIAPYSFL